MYDKQIATIRTCTVTYNSVIPDKNLFVYSIFTISFQVLIFLYYFFKSLFIFARKLLVVNIVYHFKKKVNSNRCNGRY